MKSINKFIIPFLPFGDKKRVIVKNFSEFWDKPSNIKIRLNAELVNTANSSKKIWRVSIHNKEQHTITLTRLRIFGSASLSGGNFHGFSSKDNLLESTVPLAINECYEFIFENEFYYLVTGKCELNCLLNIVDQSKTLHEWKSRLC
jgi:hypothetical protein